MSINPETAVSYAALILADEGLEVTPDKLLTLLEAAGVEIEPIWSTIFSKALKDKNIKELLTAVQTSHPPGTGTGPHGENEKTPAPDPGVGVGVDDDGNGSDSGSEMRLDLFD